jgi:hypothetical protein
MPKNKINPKQAYMNATANIVSGAMAFMAGFLSILLSEQAGPHFFIAGIAFAMLGIYLTTMGICWKILTEMREKRR